VRLTLLSALLCATAAVATEPKPSTVGSHVWDSAALARCSSPCKREVVADPQARSGQAVRFTGSAGFISMHDEIRIASGRSRFTIRLRLEKGGHFATEFEAGGRGFQSRAPIECADPPADGSFTERIVELNLPGPLNVVSWRGGLPKDLIVDRITVEPVADASPVEVASANASGYDWKQAGASWQDPHFPPTPEHPATCISYHDAERFCAWLTRHEADQGTLPSGWRYRLPTDAEWSRAAGAVEYPWGDHWPPTARDGNYCATESRIGFTDTPKWKCMEDLRDSHPRTAPVGSCTSNAFGLLDMGGNVWEWCSTWYQTNLNQADMKDPAIVQGFPALLDDGGGRQNRVVRGGSWHARRQVDLRTRFRGIGDPRIRFDDFGFRCVLACEDTTPAEWHEAPGANPASRRQHIHNL